ncbi:MAG: hypothetical protein PHP98_08530 [Kiritimatiellae bacterium]|nr:hypothetical protein [Kiritimatiellia bacterium]
MKAVAKILPVLSAGACALALCLAACESGRFDHTPPAGAGTLIVDNLTADDLLVYVNGRSVFTVDDYDHELIDLAPGVYRVVIDQKGGYHSYRGDVDILEGQLTIMETRGYYSSDWYDVRVYFD